MADVTGSKHEHHGAQHPLCGSSNGDKPWEFAPGLFAWTLGGNVVLQGDDGDVTIPSTHLAKVGKALLSQHVQNGRTPFERPAP